MSLHFSACPRMSPLPPWLRSLSREECQCRLVGAKFACGLISKNGRGRKPSHFSPRDGKLAHSHPALLQFGNSLQSIFVSTVARSLPTRLQFVYDAMVLLISGKWSLETMHAYQQTLQPSLGYGLLANLQYTLYRMGVSLVVSL